MNTSLKTRKLVVTGILTAITLLLGLTPLGYIPIPPIEITLMAIPVLIGVMTEGLATGLILGFVFGVTSFLQIFIKPMGIGPFLFNISPLKTILIIFIPRLLVPLFAWLVYKAILGNQDNARTTRRNTAYALGAFTGSITNTIFFLGLLYLLFLPNSADLAAAFSTTEEGLLGKIAVIGAINGIPEAIVAMIIVTAVCVALKAALNKKENK